MNNRHFSIVSTPIQVAEAFAFVADKRNGAISSFVGMIRDYNLGQAVSAVSYDVHKELALHTFNEICAEIATQWEQEMRIYVTHYQGRLEVGEISIMIAISAPHRNEAFQACRYMIEAIKHRFPIWKQEHYLNGDSEWVKGHALCQGH